MAKATVVRQYASVDVDWRGNVFHLVTDVTLDKHGDEVHTIVRVRIADKPMYAGMCEFLIRVGLVVKQMIRTNQKMTVSEFCQANGLTQVEQYCIEGLQYRDMPSIRNMYKLVLTDLH